MVCIYLSKHRENRYIFKKGFVMEEEKYCKENKKILEFLKENKEVIITAPAFIITVLGILYGIIRYFYSIMAERFYGIPKFYFYDSLQTDYIIKVIFFLALVMIFLSPLMIKRFLKKNKLKFFESLFYSFCLAFLIFCLSLVFCVSFIIDHLQLKGYDLLLSVLCIIAGIVSWIIYFLVFRNDLREYSNSDKQKTDEDETVEQKKSVKLTTKGDRIAFAFAIVAAICLLITSILMYNSIQFIPENKKEYEIIKESDTGCKVVIGYYKDLAILMDGKINCLDKEKISFLEIVRGEYRLESVENKKLEYHVFNKIFCKN